jgi:hypothetical protein
MGNKSRLLDEIEAAVNDVAGVGAVALDLFAGSGVVTRRMAETRDVVSSDVQAYSEVLAHALTSPTVPAVSALTSLRQRAAEWLEEVRGQVAGLIAFEQDALRDDADPATLADIIDFGSIAVPQGGNDLLTREKQVVAKHVSSRADLTIFRHYGGVYFSYSQALELDAFAWAVGSLTEDEKHTALAALMGAASECVSTVGNHFAQPLQPRDRLGRLKKGWFRKASTTRMRSVEELFFEFLAQYERLPPAPFDCRPVRGDYREVLEDVGPKVGVIYADPPYTRDHYSRFYHVLETMALGDDPGVSESFSRGLRGLSRGLYRVERHQSPFSIRSQATAAFVDLFSQAKRFELPVVLSYSSSGSGTAARPKPRVLTLPELLELAQGYFGSVQAVPVQGVSHSKFNKKALSAASVSDAEVLIMASP